MKLILFANVQVKTAFECEDTGIFYSFLSLLCLFVNLVKVNIIEV